MLKRNQTRRDVQTKMPLVERSAYAIYFCLREMVERVAGELEPTGNFTSDQGVQGKLNEDRMKMSAG